MKPKLVSGIELAFPTSVDGFLPNWAEIPEQFKGHRGTPQNRLFSAMFFYGVDMSKFKEKPGIDRAAALNHIRYVSGSFEPKHEHKEAGVAWLLSQWFEPFTNEDVEAAKLKEPS